VTTSATLGGTAGTRHSASVGNTTEGIGIVGGAQERAIERERAEGLECRDAVEGRGTPHVGMRVKIVGLGSMRELNGRIGSVIGHKRGSKDGLPRVRVRVGSRELGVRPLNLTIV